MCWMSQGAIGDFYIVWNFLQWANWSFSLHPAHTWEVLDIDSNSEILANLLTRPIPWTAVWTMFFSIFWLWTPCVNCAMGIFLFSGIFIVIHTVMCSSMSVSALLLCDCLSRVGSSWILILLANLWTRPIVYHLLNRCLKLCQMIISEKGY